MMEKVRVTVWNFIEYILKFIVFRVLHIKLRDKAWNKFIQFIKFVLVGFSNVIVSYGIYLIFFWGFQIVEVLPNTDYIVAQWIGYVLSIFWSFYWNHKYVFAGGQDTTPWYITLIKSILSYSFTGVLLNSILLVLWVQVLGISKIIAPIINLIINVPLNFVLNKFWAFKN